MLQLAVVWVGLLILPLGCRWRLWRLAFAEERCLADCNRPCRSARRCLDQQAREIFSVTLSRARTALTVVRCAHGNPWPTSAVPLSAINAHLCVASGREKAAAEICHRSLGAGSTLFAFAFALLFDFTLEFLSSHTRV